MEGGREGVREGGLITWDQSSKEKKGGTWIAAARICAQNRTRWNTTFERDPTVNTHPLYNVLYQGVLNMYRERSV